MTESSSLVLFAKIVPLKDEDAIGNQFAKESYLCIYESIGYRRNGRHRKRLGGAAAPVRGGPVGLLLTRFEPVLWRRDEK